MRRYLLWFWFSCKRLLKKTLFVTLLLLLPALTLCYTAAAEEDSGIVSVVLAAEDADFLAQQVVEKLLSDRGVIRFASASAEESRTLVEAGKADAAWIFPGNMGEKIADYLADGSEPVVLVLQREENVLLRLSREKLSGVLYESCAEPVYLRYLRANAPQLSELSDEQLTAYMARFQGNEQLFVFEKTDGSAAVPASYLISPLRGMFGVLILLCALAGAMYYLQDQEAGMFQAVPVSARGAVELGGQLAALWSVGLAATVCLAIGGLWVSAWREIVVAAVYTVCCGAFGCLMRRLCGRVGVLAGLLPLLTVVSLVVCPVFVDISALRAVQYLLPPTYYIQAVYSDRFLLRMPVYAAVCFLGCILLDKLHRKQ